MEKVELEITGINYSYSQSGAYTLILSEIGGSRRLPIIIGQFEAQSIAIEFEKLKPSRPLTHDLFKKFANTFHVKLNEVVINKFEEGVFYSILVFEKENQFYTVDARTSDAVALAIRFNCPIYTDEEILKEIGVMFEVNSEKNTDNDIKSEEEDRENELSLLSDEELNDMLNEAVESENFELASLIRDELKKRK
ncbi:MAG: bifunctional nuclease family protein [Bacteroidales bacterium]|nr:bifunctional nuclease family protein [Bacteroidales bacterium]